LRQLKPEDISHGLEVSSALLALLVVLFHLYTDHRAKPKTHTDPMTILARAAGLAILPQALVIMYATFDPSVLCRVEGLRLFFMLSGISLLYVCVKAVTS